MTVRNAQETENGTCGKIASYSSAYRYYIDSRWRPCMDNNRDALRKDAPSLGDVSSSGGGVFPWQVSDTQVRDESNDSGGRLEGGMRSVQRAASATNFCNLLPLAYFSRGLSAGEPPRRRKRLETAANPPLRHLISFAKRVSNIYRGAFTVDCEARRPNFAFHSVTATVLTGIARFPAAIYAALGIPPKIDRAEFRARETTLGLLAEIYTGNNF
ncbi:hypothetical protein K0M31_017143 [Melipona bicolor]|uniref:Uncharacterized protein n=1 Tax=Melipona bicolor TaxID=60889 RepID=A0AA40FEA0_9HYME|nr:hypothetical protein K0M31_017143 [Melipona bicolor]